MATSARNYRVEVTGWGPGAEFFRESATLRESEGHRIVQIHHPLMAGAVVFVRPAYTRSTSANVLPLVYQAASVGFPDRHGRREVSLVRLANRDRT